MAEYIDTQYLSSHAAVNCTIFPFFPKSDQKIEIRHERRNPSAASVDIARIKPQFSNHIYQKKQINFPKDIVLAFIMFNVTHGFETMH